MGLFSRKKEIIPHVEEGLKADAELVDIAQMNGMAAAIEAALRKTVDASSYYQAYEASDDQGNYFGNEFNIRATAGRIKSSYSREPWMFATATLIARTLAMTPFTVFNNQTNEIVEKHPLHNQLKMGNDLYDYKTMNWMGYLDLVLGGNYFRVFDEKFKEVIFVPVELASISVAPDGRTIDYLYIYDKVGSTKRTIVPYSQVIHHKFPNPYYPYYGMSLYTAASRPMLLDRFKNEFEMAFYLRGATNAGVIETTEDINKQRMERLMRTFEQVYTGKRNWWRTVFLPKGAKWIKAGLTMSEMQHLEGLRENRLTLLAVLGIPPSKVGIIQDVNRSTSEAQDRDFWVNTIKPLAEFIAAGWNNSYLVKQVYQNKVRVEPDFSSIEALQGSWVTKGEQAKAVQDVLWIDEIRTDILGYEPLPNGAGQKFVSEVRGGNLQQGFLSAPLTALPVIEDIALVPVEDDNAKVEAFRNLKAQATTSQERIEVKLSKGFLEVYNKYIDTLLTVAVEAIYAKRSVSAALTIAIDALEKQYMIGAEPILISALERGFSFAASQSKLFNTGSIRLKQPRFNETDNQAVEALRDEQRDGKRTALVKRGIDSFVGFNQTRSKEILDLIAKRTEEGKSLEQIAASIREDYKENYKNQSFTIARTEILTAISQGMKWNHDVLGEVFSDVKKQWFHVGDVGRNPDARDWHAEFETQGPVETDYKWNGILEYPRDYSAPPEETINCRCTMVSIVPDDAESNADSILDRLL